MNSYQISAVIVLYYPDPDKTLDLLERLAPYVGKVVLVDNTPGASCSVEPPRCIDRCIINYIALNENKGIAHAQNIGVSASLSNNVSHILFLDQDSIISKSLFIAFEDVCQALDHLRTTHFFLSPSSFDIRTGVFYPKKESHPYWCGSHLISDTTTLQSSGTLISVDLVKDLGTLFDEDLFIDYVDWDLYFRVKSLCIPTFIIHDVCMGHSRGEGNFKIPLIGPIFSISTPRRIYFQTRNMFKLLDKPHVPRSFMTKLFLYQAIRIPFLCLFSRHRFEYTKQALLGLHEGMSLLVKHRN